jgi:hypothetical protein
MTNLKYDGHPESPYFKFQGLAPKPRYRSHTTSVEEFAKFISHFGLQMKKELAPSPRGFQKFFWR